MTMRALMAALSVAMVGARVGETIINSESTTTMNRYNLKHRSDAMTMKLSLEQLSSIQLLSFSEDSDAIQIESFAISVFETPGTLSLSPSIEIIQDSLKDFLQAELSSRYTDTNHQICKIDAHILTQMTAASSRRWNRNMVSTGSQLETAIDVSFCYSPTPDYDDVDDAVLSVMSGDLSPLLSNITTRAVNDEELKEVHSVFYLGRFSGPDIVPTPPTPAPTTPSDFSGVEGSLPSSKSDKSFWSRVDFIVPVILACCLLIALLALFMHKRSRRRDDQVLIPAYTRDTKQHHLSPLSMVETDNGGVDLYFDDPVEVKSELMAPSYGMVDVSLASPRSSQKTDEKSDVFSGLDVPSSSAVGSPRSQYGDSKSVFSFLTGITSRGSRASTVMASNLGASKTAAGALAAPIAMNSEQKGPTSNNTGGTPHSRMSSLFTFSEEGSRDVEQEEDEVVAADDIEAAPSDEEQSLSTTADTPTEAPPSGFASFAAGALAMVTGGALVAASNPKKTPEDSKQQQTDSSSGDDSPAQDHPDDEFETSKDVVSNMRIVDTHIVERGGAGQTSPASFHPKSGVAAMSPMSANSDPTGKSNKKKLRWWQRSPEKKAAATSGALVAGGAVGAVTGVAIAGASHSNHHDDNTDDSMDEPGRIPTRSAGMADGTAMYQSGTAEHESPQSSKGSFMYDSSRGRSTHERAKANAAMLTVAASPVAAELSRRHAKSTTGDGTTNYQNETMGEWSVEDEHEESAPTLDDSNNSAARQRKMKIAMGNSKKKAGKPPRSPRNKNTTPRSNKSQSSEVSGLSVYSPEEGSEEAASKQLISDLLWLEQKIAATNQAAKTPSNNSAEANRAIRPNDSLSFNSGDGALSTTENESSVDRSDEQLKDNRMQTSIVCRDCFAPPGKLKIVIHSTKDGPAVHTVKPGSSLEGHIFPGDLIISVDNVDTRAYSAEQVMKMMTAKTRFERKITVLHFEASEGA